MPRFEALSPYNSALVTDDQPPRVVLREMTLRQLGHMETEMTLDEKLHFLSCLEHVGVQETVLWGVDADAADLVVQTRDRGMRIRIALFGKTFFPDEMRATVAKAKACGAALLRFNARGADFALEVSGSSRTKELEACVATVKEAKDRGVAISIGAAYATQTDPAYLQDLTGTVAEAGADRVFVADALGVISPRGMHRLVSGLRRITPAPIEVHCHNDFGLAVANSIAAVEAGATIVEAIVNGMDPERCGITPLDEVVMGLEMLYGVDTGIKLEGLTELSRLHEQLTGMHVAVNKPIVGPRAFNYRVAPGRRASQATRDQFYSSERVVPFNPAIVGNSRVFVLGKFSGPNEVFQRLDALGLMVTDVQLERLVELVRALGAASKHAVGDEDLRRLVDVVRVSRPELAPR